MITKYYGINCRCDQHVYVMFGLQHSNVIVVYENNKLVREKKRRIIRMIIF